MAFSPSRTRPFLFKWLFALSIVFCFLQSAQAIKTEADGGLGNKILKGEGTKVRLTKNDFYVQKGGPGAEYADEFNGAEKLLNKEYKLARTEVNETFGAIEMRKDTWDLLGLETETFGMTFDVKLDLCHGCKRGYGFAWAWTPDEKCILKTLYENNNKIMNNRHQLGCDGIVLTFWNDDQAGLTGFHTIVGGDRSFFYDFEDFPAAEKVSSFYDDYINIDVVVERYRGPDVGKGRVFFYNEGVQIGDSYEFKNNDLGKNQKMVVMGRMEEDGDEGDEILFKKAVLKTSLTGIDDNILLGFEQRAEIEDLKEQVTELRAVLLRSTEVETLNSWNEAAEPWSGKATVLQQSALVAAVIAGVAVAFALAISKKRSKSREAKGAHVLGCSSGSEQEDDDIFLYAHTSSSSNFCAKSGNNNNYSSIVL